LTRTALIVGSGFGGIASALRLRALGLDVHLVERLDQLGGRAQHFNVDGYRHDAGPTVITAPFLFDELFELFDEQRADHIEFKALEPWYRFEFADGNYFNYGGAPEATLSEIERLSPQDLTGYQSLLTHSKSLFDIGFTELAHQPFHRLGTMVKQIPRLARLRSDRSVWDMVCKHISDPRLRQALSIQPLLVGGSPFDTTSIYGLIHYLENAFGVHFAMGGTGALVGHLERLMIRSGISIEKNTTVTQILTSGKRAVGVKLQSGETLHADCVVFNGDPMWLYRALLDKNSLSLSGRLKRDRSKLSMGLYVLFFGTSKKYQDLAHHTIWMGERYRGLLDDIFHRGVLADDFSLYLHRPTATDPSFAPSGHDSFYVLAPVPNQNSSINWSVEEPRLRDRIIDALDRTIMPELKSHIRSVFAMTPDDFEHKYLSFRGAGFSIAPLFSQSAWFRFHNQAERIENLYLAGAGTHPGAGVPGVLSSAKVIEALILQKMRAAKTKT